MPGVGDACAQTGRLEVVHGSMFAGKTEHVIARLRQEESHGRRVRAFKHSSDARYAPAHLVTHRGDQFAAVRVPNAEAILEHVDDVDTVAIDEGHFFKVPLIAIVAELRARGLSVLVAGITHDAWGRPFDPFPQLAAIADDVVFLQAPCRVCGEPAAYTQRITPVNTQFMVGGVGDYEPRCKTHFEALDIPPEPR
jgi:thymidine kinase